MKTKMDIFKNSKAQSVIEYLLLTIVVVFVVLVFVLQPGAPRETFNMVLQDPIYMIHKGTNQIQL